LNGVRYRYDLVCRFFESLLDSFILQFADEVLEKPELFISEQSLDKIWQILLLNVNFLELKEGLIGILLLRAFKSFIRQGSLNRNN